MRKKFHKILSLSLAAVMVFSMAVPSYAAAPPDVPAESIVAEEAVNDADVQDTNEPAPAEAPDAVPAPVPDETPAEEAKPDDVSNAPADEEAPAPEIPDEELPKEEEPEVPAEPLTHKVKFLAGSDAHGVIFVDGEEVDIASFVMELYPEDTVTFGVEPNSMDYVVSAVDFTGDCSLEAVEGGFVLKDVKTDVDLLVTYEEGTPTQDTALLATTYDLSAAGDGSITASLNGTTLTVTGSGAMGNWTDRTSPVYGVCTSVTKIVLDNRITYIGNFAFSNFTALTAVEGGSGVTNIGNYAFNRCSVLRSVNFPALKTLGTHVFYRCAKLGSNEAGNGNIPLDFPELVTAGDYAFYGCNWLEQLNVPKLERIGQMCFMNSCVGEGNFPALKSYGAHAFVGRTDIPSFTFGALEDCSDWLINQMPGCSLISMPNLTNISYSQAPFDNVGVTIGSNTGVGQLRVEWPKLMNSSWVPTAKWSIPDNTVFVLPEGSNLVEPLTNLGYTVEHPADDSGNPKLSSLSVTLTSDMLASDLVIPFSVFPENASVSNIQYTIYNADGTTTSTAADASRALVSNDVDGAVFVIRSLQLAKMWRNANTVRNAFDIEFESGQTIRFTVYTPTHETPAGEWNIGKTESDNVTAMLVGSELRIYGSGTMKEWDIGKTPWNGKTITKIIIGDGVLNIGRNMGYNLRSLVSVTGGADVTDIGSNAFANCKKLQTVECMGQAKSIGSYAFEYCSSLKSIDISSCESFGYSVFRNLNNVREIILGQSYDSNSFFDQSFPKLETVRAEFVVLPSNFPFLGGRYSGTNCGLSNASGVLTVELPNCVSSLWEPTAESRARCAARTIVKVPGNTEFADKLRAAGYEVEGQAENPSNAVLAKTEIDPTVEIVTGGLSIPFSSIDDSATAVTNVTAVRRGKSQYTVKRSKDLFSIDRSGSEVMLVVNKDAVFCNSYKSSAEAPFMADYYVTLNDEAGSVVRFTINYENTEFWDVSEEQNRSLIAVVSYDTNTMEIVGDGTFKTGQSAQSGSNGISHGFGYPQFKEDKDYHLILDDRLTSLPSGCFSGMNFVDIQGGANIRSIGISAFEGCKKLTTVSFPSVEMIGSDAFYGCSSLKQVIMPNVTNVSSSSFGACGFDELTSETLQFSDSWSIGIYKYAFTGGNYKKVDLPNLKNPGCNNFNSQSAFDHIVYTVGEHMYENVNLKSAHFPGLKSLDVNLFEPAKAENVAIADGLYFEDLTSLNLANLHPKSWESSSFDIYIPKCTSLSAAGHNLPGDVLFHIPNNRTVIEECNRYNLKYVIDGSAEMDDAEVTLRLYDLTDETFTTLKTVRLSVSGADGIGYTEQYTIPELSTLLGIGKDYAGLISVTGSWTDGGVKREGDKVFFAAPADKNLVVTYVVYDYGTIAEMTPVKEHIAPKVEVPYTFDIYTTPTSGGYTHYTRRAFVLYNPDGTLNVSMAKCVKYYYKREKGTELTSYVADEIMKHITISPNIYEIDMERGLFTDENDITDISCYVYLKFKSDLSDAFSHTVTFMDEDEVVRTWNTADSDTIYAPDRPGRAGYEFLGWSETAGSTTAEFAPGGLIDVDKDLTLYAVWAFDYDYPWAEPFLGSVIYYGPYGDVLYQESKELEWGRNYDLREWNKGNTFEKDGISYVVDHADGLWTGVCDRNVTIRVYAEFSPDTVFPDRTVTYRLWDTYNQKYVELGTASASQSESNPGVSNSFTIPAITDFDGLVEDDTFVNMYRVTGSFLESEADEGDSVTFDMTSDAYVTYWVSIYDANGVPRDVDSETDSSATYTERWTSLIYTGLSSYRHFTGQVRYHANYPSGYDPVHTVTVPCSTDTRANSGDSTPADSRYDSTGNRQIETTETSMLFKAPAGYQAVSTPITWQAFHGTNGTTSRSFSCYWYKEASGKTAVGPNPGPSYTTPVVDVYGSWEPIAENGYTITFIDGTVTVQTDKNLQNGDLVYAPKTGQGSSEKRFVGWATSPNSQLIELVPGERFASSKAAVYYAVYEKAGFSLGLEYVTGDGSMVLSQTLGIGFSEGDRYDVSGSIEKQITGNDGHHYVTEIPEKTTGKISGNTVVSVPCYLDDNQNGVPDEKEITVEIPIVDKDGNPVGSITVTGEKDKPFDLTDLIKDPYVDDEGREWTIETPENGPVINLTENPDALTAERKPEDFVIDLKTEDGTKVGEITITAIPGDPYDLTPEIENGFADDKGQEYDIVPPKGGNTIIAGELDFLIVNPITGSGKDPGDEKDPVPPTALDTIIYEFYKDQPSEIAVPIQMNDAKNLIRLRLGNEKMPEDAYGMADSAIILNPEYLMGVDPGSYRLLPTFDDPDGTTIPNIIVKVYESIADHMDPVLFYKRILFDGTSMAMHYHEGLGEGFAEDVLALVIDDKMVTPAGEIMDFTDENVGNLVSKGKLRFRSVFSLLDADAFSAGHGQIMLDGPFVSSLNLSAGDHLVGAVFDNTHRTTDVNKVILTIPRQMVSITMEFVDPDGNVLKTEVISGYPGDAYDLKNHIPSTITGADGKVYVPGELADTKGQFDKDGVIQIPCVPKDEGEGPGPVDPDPGKPKNASLTVKFINENGRVVRSFTIEGEEGAPYDVSGQIPALFVGTDGKAYTAQIPEGASGTLKGHGVLTVPVLRKTGSVTPEEPGGKDPVKPEDQKPGTSDGDKRPGGTITITKPGNTTITNNTTTNTTTAGGTKTVTLNRPSGSLIPSVSSSGKESGNVTEETNDTTETVEVPDYRIPTSTADKTDEEGGANMELTAATAGACSCQCFTWVILFLAFVLIALFVLWLVITDRRRREDREQEERRSREKA